MGFLSQDYLNGLNSQSDQPASTPTQPVTPPAPATVVTPPASTTPAPSGNPILDAFPQKSPASLPANTDTGAPVNIDSNLTPEEQTAKFGGPVGSQAYNDFKNKQDAATAAAPMGALGASPGFRNDIFNNLASVVGMKLPDTQTWDTMSTVNKIATVGKAGAFALARMLGNLPKAIVKAPVTVALMTAKPWTNMAEGKPADFNSLANEKPTTLPWLGAVPNYFQTFQQAKDSGMGDLGALVSTIGQASGDIAITASLGDAVKGAFQPRDGLVAGQPVQNVEPIKYAMDSSGVYRAAPEGSTAEYYSMPKTVAKESYGGTTGNTFLKITPAGSDAVELSVVQVRTGAVPTAIDYVKNKFGVPDKTYQGDFGREVKLESQTIPINSPNVPGQVSQTLPYQSPSTLSTKIPSSLQEFQSLAPDMQNKVFDRLTPELQDQVHQADAQQEINSYKSVTPLDQMVSDIVAGKTKIKVSDEMHTEAKEALGGRYSRIFTKDPNAEAIDQITEQVRRQGMDVTNSDVVEAIQKKFEDNATAKTNAVTARQTAVATGPKSPAPIEMTPEEKTQTMINIPSKPLKGFEKAPITHDQISTLSQIGEVNRIDPSIRDAVIKTVTGKTLGEMTQTDFVKAAQTLATFNDLEKYAPKLPQPGVGQYLSPQRKWMADYETKAGVPLYSEVYQPMEDAIRLRNMFRDSYRNQARDIFGKYAGTGYGEERRLVSSYMRGETETIDGNPKLSPSVKTDLVNIATQMRKIYDTVGPKLDIPTDIFLKDYQPRIQNIGGIYQLYKEGSEVPKQLDFFAKFERKGQTPTVQIDDALALFDIYINSGSNRYFVNPALERVGAMSEQLPDTLKGSVKSYVLEKLGYGGRLEKFLDDFVPGINAKLGINLPADSARRLTNLGLSTVYSGLLSSPATWFRQAFHYPLFGFARMGSKFAPQAIAKGLTEAGIQEARDAGVMIPLGVPHGEEIAQDATGGGKVVNQYRNLTQKIIQPNSIVENRVRAITYHQSKMIFEDAVAKYNSGKLDWTGAEKAMDLQSFSLPEQNIIRQKLINGDIAGATQAYTSSIVDDINFPYRKGASSRVTYGLAGKLGTSLLQWPIEAGHTLGGWAKTGQWDKLIRWYAASAAIKRTLEDTFGFNFERSLLFGPFNNFYSPFVQTAQQAIGAFTAFMQNNHQTFNQNSDAIVKTLKSAGIPGGVELQNINSFWKSYNEGPDDSGQFPIYNAQGQMQYRADFADLFWGQLMGMPTSQKLGQSNLQTDLKNATYDQTQAKEQALELLQQQKYDEAAKIIEANGINITPQDMDKYVIPLNQRTFMSLPDVLKAKFAPRVFPDAFNTPQE